MVDFWWQIFSQFFPEKKRLNIFQEKASAEIRGEFFRPNSRVNFAVDFWWLFSLEKNRRKKSTKKSTAIFKSEFGSFGAKIHTARIRP